MNTLPNSVKYTVVYPWINKIKRQPFSSRLLCRQNSKGTSRKSIILICLQKQKALLSLLLHLIFIFRTHFLSLLLNCKTSLKRQRKLKEKKPINYKIMTQTFYYWVWAFQVPSTGYSMVHLIKILIWRLLLKLLFLLSKIHKYIVWSSPSITGVWDAIIQYFSIVSVLFL